MKAEGRPYNLDFFNLIGAAEEVAEKCFPRHSLTSAADSENKPVTAAVNRCATQNQVQHRLFSSL